MATETYSERINGRDLIVTDGQNAKGVWGFDIEMLEPYGGYATDMERQSDIAAFQEAIIAALPWRGLIWNKGYLVSPAIVGRSGLPAVDRGSMFKTSLQVWAENSRGLSCGIEEDSVGRGIRVMRCSVWGCENRRDCEGAVDVALAALADSLPEEGLDATARELGRMMERGEREWRCHTAEVRATLDSLTGVKGKAALFLGQATVWNQQWSPEDVDRVAFIANYRQLLSADVDPARPPVGETIDIDGAMYAIRAPGPIVDPLTLPCVLTDRLAVGAPVRGYAEKVRLTLPSVADNPEGHYLLLRASGHVLRVDEGNSETRCHFNLIGANKVGGTWIDALMRADGRRYGNTRRVWDMVAGKARVEFANRRVKPGESVQVEGRARLSRTAIGALNWHIWDVTGLRVDDESVSGDPGQACPAI